MDYSNLTNYDNIAEQYSEYIDNKSWNKLYERPYILSCLENLKNKNVVDIGCASGFYSKYAIDNGANVIAVDISKKMIDITKKKINSDKLKTFVADISKPMAFIGNDSQDLIICSLVLHYIENLEVPIFEFYRILKKNGKVIISMHHPFCDYLHLKKESYFDSIFIEDAWKGFGDPMKVHYFTRPLNKILKPFLDSKFIITGIDEPLPVNNCKIEDPACYERLSKKPAFIFIKLLKL